jgi:hypothetical protein
MGDTPPNAGIVAARDTYNAELDNAARRAKDLPPR